jgi:hypothetical protein
VSWWPTKPTTLILSADLGGVVVIGLATTVTDPDQMARYEQILQPWVNMAMDTVVAIEPQIVTGVHIVANSG